AQAARARGTLVREAPNSRSALLQRADPFWRVVIAVVDQAELELGNSESCLQAVPQRLDVACFIARGHDNADQRGVGDHGRRIGGYPAVHGLDSRGPPPNTGCTSASGRRCRRRNTLVWDVVSSRKALVIG